MSAPDASFVVRRALTLLLLLAALHGETARAMEEPPPPAGPGSYIEELNLRGKLYKHARIRTITRSGVTFQYEGGLRSAPWTELPASWRVALASQIPTETVRRAPKIASPTPEPVEIVPVARTNPDALFSRLGTTPEIRSSVDMRDRLKKLGLWVKNQGKRPSCSVYAILSALELQFAEANGAAVRFDEEHVLKATETVTGRTSANDGTDRSLEADAGYTLPEVVLAIRAQGLKVMPNTDAAAGASAHPAFDERPTVQLHILPQGPPPTTIGNIIHALNQGLPVPIGLAWPNARATQGGYLDTQPAQPGAGHAVTLMGYQSNSGRIEDTVFVFKNSWGVSWGASGYGRVTYAYLARHLQCAVVLQLPPPVQMAGH